MMRLRVEVPLNSQLFYFLLRISLVVDRLNPTREEIGEGSSPPSVATWVCGATVDALRLERRS